MTPPREPTRALSFRQPWVWAILQRGKRIENRVDWRGCSYRGPIWIHAAQGMTLAEHTIAARFIVGATTHVPVNNDLPLAEALKANAEAWAAVARDIPGSRMFEPRRGTRAHTTWIHDVEGRLDRHALRRSGIVARADIVAAFDTEAGLDAMIRTGDVAPEQRRWWVGSFALVLANVETVPFRPCPGALGFFEPRPIEVPQ